MASTTADVLDEILDLRARAAALEKGLSDEQRAALAAATHDSAAEASGREAARFYPAVLDALSVAVAVLDARGFVIAQNRAWLRFAEQHGHAAVGQSYLERCPAVIGLDPPAEVRCLAVVRDVIRGDRQYFAREYACAHAGSQRWYGVEVSAVSRPRGRAVAVATHRDLTDRVLAEEASRRAEERLRKTIDHGWDVIILADAARRPLFVSAAIERVLGFTPDEIHESSLTGLIHPEDRALAREQREALRGAAEGRGLGALRMRHKDGGYRWIEVSSFDLLDDPAVGAVVSYLRDITAQRRVLDAIAGAKAELEERVAERTADLTDLYDHAPCGYYSLRADGVFKRVNATLLGWLGFTREELIGKRRSLDLVVPEEREDTAARFAGFVREGQVTGLAVRLLRKDGRPLPVVLNAIVLRDVDGAVAAIRATVFDDTERRQAEEEIRRANGDLARAGQAKNEFLAGMSHELRTPLNGILGMAELLSEEVYGPLNDKQRGALRRLDDCGRHLLSLINDVLDLSKVEAGKLDLDLAPVNAAEVCRQSAQILHDQAMRKGISLSIEVPDRSFAFLADERRLKQILVNLLSNAVKFTPPGGAVRLSATALDEGSMASFAVADSGIGISTAEQARLFQPFVQLDNSLSRGHAGTGLGLSLVRKLVERHGGRVEVVSQPGQGSRFSVVLPAREIPPRSARAAALSLSASRSIAPPAASGAQARILFADDDRINSELVVEFLVARGYEVHVARDGQEAVDRAKALSPEVVIMDVQMPGVDGLAAMRMIRGSGVPGLDTVPMIALTALAMRGDRERCVEAGANVYLPKPVSLRGLASVLAELLSGREAARG